MPNISNKAKTELDKIINIANTYREGSISESMFYDIVYSLKEKDEQIPFYKEYLSENYISIVSGEEDVEDLDEQVDDSVLIKPYDTANIDISPKPLSLDTIIARLENDEIDLMPDFQRKAGLWTKKQKSQLIESLILRIPLPAFYFDGSYNDKWIVIDGLQRLTALKEFFVDKTLRLSELEFLKDLQGTCIDDMPRAYIRRMNETQIITYIINPGAPINLKYNIFKRINTGGLSLEPQEIRHALYQGFASDYLKKLSNLEVFKRATGYSIKTDRMLDREFVLRFIAFYEIDEDHYRGSIELFLNSAMEYLNKSYNQIYASNVECLFAKVLQTCEQIFGKFAFRKMPDKEKRRPISKALFETWTTILARLSLDELNYLVLNKELLLNKYIIMFNEDREFLDSLNSAKISSIKKRFDKIEELINEVLKNAEKD
jgi:hypothetical protein